jgi:hypothetical protein
VSNINFDIWMGWTLSISHGKLHLNPSGKEFIHPLAIFRGILKGSTPSKYQSRYLTPCCGIEAQSPTHALTLVKGPSNAFDLTPKWERTLPSFGNFPWDIERVHPIPISQLIFVHLLSAYGSGLSQLKTGAIPLN